MPRFVAFLRAVNVGGRVVKMNELRTLFESLGLKSVETFIASGNVIFESNRRSVPSLERRIEDHLRKALGYEVKTFIRTDAEVAAIAKHKPFSDAAIKSATALNVGLMAEPLGGDAKKSLGRFKTEIDDFHVHGNELYWLCRKKQSESTFSNAAFEKGLGVRATFRGMNTMRRLAERLGGP